MLAPALLGLLLLPGAARAATLPVTTTADSGAGSLRQAIASARAGDIIAFQNALTGTITLTSGELAISKALTIQGPPTAGGPNVMVSGGAAQRVFHVTAGGALTLSGLGITQGKATGTAGGGEGGGISAEAGTTLSLAGCTLTGNAASSNNPTGGAGGALSFRGSSLFVSNCTFTNNTTTGIGGAVYDAASQSSSFVSCTFTTNQAVAAGGALVVDAQTSATVTNCSFTGSTVTAGSGGALYVLGSAILSRSTVTGGSASGGSTQASMSSSASRGGGICVISSTGLGLVQLMQSTVSSNSAAAGGGIYCLGTLSMNSSTVSGNTASGDAGTGDGGAGILLESGGAATLLNSTIAGNTASGGSGGGLLVHGTASLTSCTVAYNSAGAGSGGGIAALASGGGAPAPSVQLSAVLTARNTANASNDVFGAFTSSGSNLVGEATGGTGFTAARDQAGTAAAPIDPLLSALGNNGGLTQTIALGANSPAVNGDYTATAPPVDQRGDPRPRGERADIGAFEAFAPPLRPQGLTAAPSHTRVTLTFTASAGATSYNIYRGITPGGESATPVAVGVPGTRYVDYGLSDGRTYYYVVRAVNVNGTGEASAEASAIPRDDRINDPTRIRGSVLSWGDNTQGQLGTGDLTAQLLPTPIAAPQDRVSILENAVQVSGGLRFSVALTADGTVYAWGDDQYGQLGGYVTSNGALGSPTPVAVPFTSSVNIVQVAAGQDFALALDADGTVYAWGRNQYGQLGSGNASANTFFSRPQRVVSGNRIGILTGIVGIAAGGYHCLALRADGTVVAWGYNSNGQLGNAMSGSGTDSAVPVTVRGLSGAVQVAAGQYHSLALTQDGLGGSLVSAWGYNNDGELGSGNGSASLPQTIPNFDGVVQIAAGQYHSLGLTSDGSLYAWGRNDSGQLGDGSVGVNSTRPFVVTDADGAPLSGVLAAAVGALHSLVIRTDHSGLSWGSNVGGQLGNGSTSGASSTDTSLPSPILSAQGGTQLSLYGLSGGGLHSLALLNLPPTAIRDAYTVRASGRTVSAAVGVLANDTDPEGDSPLFARLVRTTAHGTLVLSADGSFTYAPNAGYSGLDAFSYAASDSLGLSIPVTVTLTVTTARLQTLTVTPANPSIAQSTAATPSTQQFTATATYSDGANDTVPNLGWTSSDPATASIDAVSGLATAAQNNFGVVTITVTDPLTGVTGTATLTVRRTAQSVAVTPLTASLPKGSTQQYTATVTYTDGSTGPATVFWSAASGAIASITRDGLATAQGVGQTTIRATTTPATGPAGITGTATLTVTAAALSSITIAPNPVALTKGIVRQLVATGTFTDGTTQDYTQQLNWTTTNPNVSLVDGNGVISGVGVGSASVAGTDPATGQVGTAPVTVTDPAVTPRSRLLWTLTGDRASVWMVEADGRYSETVYGPYPGWKASAISTGPDGVTHIVWNNVNGTVSLWNLTPAGTLTFANYGPFRDGPQGTLWTAIGLSTGPNGVTHLLWTNTGTGRMSTWEVRPDFSQQSVYVYGPFAGWAPRSIATGPDGVTHIVWNNVNGLVSLWATDSAGGYTFRNYGPYVTSASDRWLVQAMSVGTDGSIQLLWNNVNGTMSLWNVGLDGGFVSHNYGPYPGGWTAYAVATDPTNLSHIFWFRPDGNASLWDINAASGGFNFHLYGPLTNYQAAGLSAGP